MEANLRRKSVIKRDQVRVEGHELRSAAPCSDAPPAPCASAPRVRLLQLDEHAQAIEFTCSCGEVSLIEIHSDKKP